MHGILLDIVRDVNAGGAQDVGELVAFAFKTIAFADSKEDFGVGRVGAWRAFIYT